MNDLRRVLCLLASLPFTGCALLGGASGPLDGVPPPTKAIGMRRNFLPIDGSEPAGPPGIFVRAAGSVGRAGEEIVVPAAYDEVRYEGELVIVIGKRATAVSVEDAPKHILGYTCGMDGSPAVRDAAGGPDVAASIAGKSADGVAPIGPTIVTELDPNGHAIILRVNGEEVERANTKDHVWDPARTVSEVSKLLTLEPGDVIFAGARQAIPKMKPGDQVEVEIEGISRLECEVVAGE